MKNLEDYENRIDHLDSKGTINHTLYIELKHRVGNMIGRKYEHELYLEDERALDIQEKYFNTVVNVVDDVVDYVNFLEFLKYGLN